MEPLPYTLIESLTGNLDPQRQLGEGSFAVVYLGDVSILRNVPHHTATNLETALMPMIKHLPRFVAVKVDKIVAAKEGESAKRLEQRSTFAKLAEVEELRVCTNYRHRFMCGLLGFSVDGPTRCMVYEYCEGGPLSERLGGTVVDPRTGELYGRLDWAHRLRLIAQVGSALEYLHMAAVPPVFHLDVKPDK